MIEQISASALATIALAIGQLWVLDRLFTTYHKAVPAGLSNADGSQCRYWERWCYQIMSETAILSVVTGLLVGVSAANYRGESWLPLFASLTTAAAVWAILTARLRPNRQDVSLWNRRNQKHLFVSMLAAAAAGTLLIAGLGGTVPLLIGGGAFAFAWFVSFVSGL